MNRIFVADRSFDRMPLPRAAGVYRRLARDRARAPSHRAWRRPTRWLITVVALAGLIPSVGFAATFFGPTSYTQPSDVPAGFYGTGETGFLEDFEDGTIDGGLTVETFIGGNPVVLGPGNIISPGISTDSVDADDGSIDGLGRGGRSLFTNGQAGIRITVGQPVVALGLVWTDGFGDITFSAFDPVGNQLFTDIFSGIPNAGQNGETDDDSFFGIRDLNGVGSIFVSNSSGGIEIDHVQYSVAAPAVIPAPASLLLLLGALGFGAALVRGRRTG